MRVGILNVTGYAGAETVRILMRHPEVKVTSVTGRSAVGQKLGDVFPHLAGLDLTIEPELGDVDFVISALPHKASAEAVAPLVARGLRVVDISADFRLKSPQAYEEWYETPHPAPNLLEEAVYGLTELHRKEVASARVVANPGCYPTSIILAVFPALKEGVIDGQIIADSKSGVSGAGRSLSLFTHFSEVNENVQAYGLKGHRHLPEIIQELEPVAGPNLTVTFVPHLIPMTRGILSTCYAPLKQDLGDPAAANRRLRELYLDYYGREPFVKVVSAPPQTKHTLGNNDCLIYPCVDPRANRLIVVSCLDNLVKGAAGQAVQNMNVMLGLPETMGLEQVALYP
jgi:N-acetyl-gamma-glutamyl-phosphate reductase